MCDWGFDIKDVFLCSNRSEWKAAERGGKWWRWGYRVFWCHGGITCLYYSDCNRPLSTQVSLYGLSILFIYQLLQFTRNGCGEKGYSYFQNLAKSCRISAAFILILLPHLTLNLKVQWMKFSGEVANGVYAHGSMTIFPLKSQPGGYIRRLREQWHFASGCTYDYVQQRESKYSNTLP